MTDIVLLAGGVGVLVLGTSVFLLWRGVTNYRWSSDLANAVPFDAEQTASAVVAIEGVIDDLVEGQLLESRMSATPSPPRVTYTARHIMNRTSGDVDVWRAPSANTENAWKNGPMPIRSSCKPMEDRSPSMRMPPTSTSRTTITRQYPSVTSAKTEVRSSASDGSSEASSPRVTISIIVNTRKPASRRATPSGQLGGFLGRMPRGGGLGETVGRHSC